MRRLRRRACFRAVGLRQHLVAEGLQAGRGVWVGQRQAQKVVVVQGPAVVQQNNTAGWVQGPSSAMKAAGRSGCVSGGGAVQGRATASTRMGVRLSDPDPATHLGPLASSAWLTASSSCVQARATAARLGARTTTGRLAPGPACSGGGDGKCRRQHRLQRWRGWLTRSQSLAPTWSPRLGNAISAPVSCSMRCLVRPFCPIRYGNSCRANRMRRGARWWRQSGVSKASQPCTTRVCAIYSPRGPA